MRILEIRPHSVNLCYKLMNELTKSLVIETAKDNIAAAKKNDSTFANLVDIAHWSWLIANHGWKFKQRAVDLFRQWHPEIYDGDFIQDYHTLGFDIDVMLSNIAMRCLWRKVVREPDLQLTKDWGDLPIITVQPQMNMFAELETK